MPIGEKRKDGYMKQNKRTLWQGLAALLLVFTLLLSPVSAQGLGAGTHQYENEVQLMDNLTLGNVISYTDKGRQEGYYLELEPGGDVYPIVLACDTIYGGMTATAVAEYAESQGYQVVAAINTDFFIVSNHVPVGLVIEDGIYKSSSEGRNAILIDEKGRASLLEKANITIELEIKGEDQVFTVQHLNKTRNDSNGLYLFSDAFSTVSTRTSTPGWFVVFEIQKGELTPEGSMTLEVVDKLTSSDAVPLSEGYLVLSAGNASKLDSAYNAFSLGDKVTLTTTASDEALAEAQWASGGGDILVEDWIMTDSSQWDSSISGANPRSALGIRSDGSLYLYVADGRRSSYANGLTLTQLAEEMMAAGCEQVINLDGGGSSVLGLRQPGENSLTSVNRPSDGSQRRCATYLLLVTDNRRDGEAESLFLNEEGTFILRGASTTLSAAAMDAGWAPATLTDTVSFSASAGSMNGNVYTASGSGQVTISLSGDGASGQGHVYVVDQVDDLRVSVDGVETSTLRLFSGETAQLSVEATYLGRSVITNTGVGWNLVGDIGTIDENGYFTAGSKTNVEGKIVVSCGATQKEITVTIPAELEDIRGHWCEPYVRILFQAGIVSGVTNTEYQPQGQMKRGDFILMLYRAAGSPLVTGSSSFSDVYAGDYYANAILWAESKGIATGTGDGLFHPKDNLTREQAFALIYRSYNALGQTTPVCSDTAATLAQFTDKDQLSDYSVDATAALVSVGVVQGSNNALNPKATLTRAEMAKMLCVAIQ